MKKLFTIFALIVAFAAITKSQTTIWSEGFEGSLSAYDRASYCGSVVCDWYWVSCKAYAGSRSLWGSAVGSSCTATNCTSYPNNLCNYVGNINPIDISCYTNRIFSFRVWREMGSNDELSFKVNNGSGWITVTTYSTSNNTWGSVSYNIPSSANTFKWQFDFITNGISSSEDGVYLDDMKITGTLSGQAGTATVTGVSSGCEGSDYTYGATSNGATSFNWTVPSDWTINSGQGTSSINVTFGNSSGNVCATPSNSCGNGTQDCQSVTVNPLPSATANNQGPYCDAKTIQLNSSGGSSYSWSGPGSFASALQNPTRSNITMALGGTYTVTVTNSSGCTNVASTSVTVISNPSATANNQGPYCAEETIQLNSSGGTSCTWSGPGGWTSSSCNPTRSNATTSMSGTYTVTVTNASGCTDEESTSVTVNPNPSVTTTATDTDSPGGSCDGGAAVTVSGGTAPYTYSWPGGSNCASNTCNTLCAGTNMVTVTDANGCSSSSTVQIIVGIEKVSDFSYLSVHPNPTTGTFTLEMELTKLTNFEIKVLNILGQMVYEEKLRDISGKYQKVINMSNSSKGIYNLQLINNEGVLNKKIMLQ